MKKIISILLVGVMCSSLCACVNKSDTDSDIEYVLESFFAQDNYYERMNYLEENYENYPKLTTNEIEEVIESDWLSMNVEAVTCEDWWTFEYDDGVREQKLHYYVGDGGFKKYDVEGHAAYYRIENDTLYILYDISEEDLSKCEGYEMYKLYEDFYFMKKVSGEIYEYSVNDFIYVKLDVQGKMIYENPEWENYKMYDLFK